MLNSINRSIRSRDITYLVIKRFKNILKNLNSHKYLRRLKHSISLDRSKHGYTSLSGNSRRQR